MVTKTITIMDDAYDLLLKSKRKDESFSDVIRRVFGKKDLMQFAGAWKDVPDKQIDQMKKNILTLRESSTAYILGNRK